MTEQGFRGFLIFIGVAFTYITFGILFGALNSLRMAEIIELNQIHQTHWTSTLFGGMTILMMGLIYTIFSRHMSERKWPDQLMYAVLVIFVLATISNYINAWAVDSPLGRYFEELVRLGSLIYLISFGLMIYLNQDSWNAHPSFIPLYFAVGWMGVSQLIFLGFRGVIGAPFRVPYIYGFFSLTLFGSLYYLLPILYRSGPRGFGPMWRDAIMISLSAVSLLINEFVDLQSLFGFIGSILWGLVGFLFILYIFDLIFKNGMKTGLLGLSLALVMFGFFVFDTFMKAVFPVWVSESHAHFMFLGTLLIAILSTLLAVEEKEQSELGLYMKLNMGLVASFVILVLGGFVWVAFAGTGFGFAGYMGIGLFVSVLMLEFQYVSRLKSGL
ncbi:MAG: hypothetical protein ACXAE3_04710 [Candidatus Kariarchaeaceae archaeon]|jgi:hypothetical protein